MTTRTSYLQGLLCSVALIFPTTMVVTTSIATQALAGGSGGNAGGNAGQGGTGGFGGGGGQGGGTSNWGGLSDPVNSGGAGLGGSSTQGGGGGGAGVPGGAGGTGFQGGAGGSGGQHGVVNVEIPIGIFPIPTEGAQGAPSAAIGAADGGGGGAGGFGAVITGEIVGGMSGPVLVNGAAGGNGGNSVAANVGVGGGGGGGGLGILFLDTVTDFQLNGTVSGAAGGRGGNRLDGGGGGGGGEGVVFAGATNAINLSTETSGGQGGDGGNGGASALYGTGFHGGDGGGAGAGAAFHALANGIVFDGNIIGGAGGNGGDGGDGITGGIFDGAGGDGGSGGAGGEGVVFDARADEIDVNTTISGGSGGDGGQGGAGISGNDGAGGSGGAGGAGIVFMDGGTVMINAAVLGGTGGTGAGSSAAGAGGAGITGSNLSIINSGTITGGLGGDGTTRADAVSFTGGANRLELRAGSSITGNVDATAGLGDTLVLGGNTDPSSTFDVSNIVSTPTPEATDHYVGFEHFEKTGASTWTLDGTGTQDWLINNGTLIGDTNSFGGDLTFGTGAGTRGVVFDQTTNGTYSGVITGDGSLTKTGGGTLTLTADNDFGVFTIHDGTLLIDEGILELSKTGFQSFIGQNAGDDAELFIANGGAVSTVDKVHVGDAANSQGRVVITGNGSSLDVGDLTVGFGGDGALSVAEGGHLQTVGFMNVGGGNYGRQGTGILSISGAGSRAEIGSNFVVAGLGDGSTGHVTLSDGGVLDVEADVRMGWGNASGSASLNIGAASSDAADAVAAGRLVAGQLQFYTGSASLNFNHTDDAYVFDTPLTSMSAGTGFIHHYAGDTILTGDSSSFSGDTIVHGGALSVGSVLGGTVRVEDGGTLGGIGTVGTTTIASGGKLSPGNSIGTLTVDGDLVFHAGSRFAIEVNPEGSDSDLVAVTGNATLNGGSVAHIGANGKYDLRSTYTILSADGTLSGAFEGVTSNFAFLNPHLLYDYGAGTIDLELARNDRDFASAAHTPNQIATAEGIETIGFDAGHPVYDAIAQLAVDNDLIRASFDALSGEIHASTQTALIEDSRFIRNAANDRIRAAFATAGASYAPVLAYGSGDTPRLVVADHGGPVFWSHGFGSWGSTNSDGNAASLDRSTGGLLVGTDTLVGDWRVGVLAGYSHSRFDVENRAATGSSDNYHLGLYGGTKWGDIAFRTGAAYTWHDIDTNRAVAIPGLADSLGGNYSAGTFQTFGELGYGIEIDSNTHLEPFANFAHVSLHTDSFTEQGGAAALSANSGSTNITFTTLGLRGEHAMTLGTIDATLRGMVGWQHAFGDTTPDSIHAFSAGNAFSIAGAPIAKDSAVIEAGLDINLTPEATFGLFYTGQIASDAYDHGFKANLAVRF